ncbi:MAG: hypothetical protein EA425_16585 [Puniceicoccaceae bacterium]|nr:MAG: hypothetical protein EA425_16585 [Puniceicoccaceae bacterium]
MPWKNLLSIFSQNDLYTQALEESHRMLDLALTMYEASVESLRRRDDGTMDIDLYAMDKQVNRYERDVRRKVMTHLSVSGPSELASGLVLVSVVIDIERIADYAKNIHDLARNHPRRLEGGAFEPRIASIEEQAGEVFRGTVEAFKSNNLETARQVMVNYKEKLSAECDQLVHQIVAGELPDVPTGTATAIALYVRYLKRIAAHSRNLVSGLVNPFPRLGYREKKPESLEL